MIFFNNCMRCLGCFFLPFRIQWSVASRLLFIINSTSSNSPSRCKTKRLRSGFELGCESVPESIEWDLCCINFLSKNGILWRRCRDSIFLFSSLDSMKSSPALLQALKLMTCYYHHYQTPLQIGDKNHMLISKIKKRETIIKIINKNHKL